MANHTFQIPSTYRRAAHSASRLITSRRARGVLKTASTETGLPGCISNEALKSNWPLIVVKMSRDMVRAYQISPLIAPSGAATPSKTLPNNTLPFTQTNPNYLVR